MHLDLYYCALEGFREMINTQFLIKNRQILRDVLALTIIYILAHWMMLVLTGTFHDDWLSLFHDVQTKDIEGIESGRPYYSAIIELVWNLPGYGYRVLCFITYYVSYLFLYFTVRETDRSDLYAPLVITLLVITLPINDARVILANYPYALGYSFFWVGCYVLFKDNCNVLHSPPRRCAADLLFFCSFTLNSNLVMYGAVLLLFLKKAGMRSLFYYFELLLLPLIFYFGNRILYPVYGAYENYNAVTVDGLMRTIWLLPSSVMGTIQNILNSIRFAPWLLPIAILSIAVGFVTSRFWCIIDKNINVQYVAFGLVVFLLGMFPYSLVRNGAPVDVVGIAGRDSIQIGVGIAIILYYLPKKDLVPYCVSLVACMGIWSFNVHYLDYQAEWYRQIALQQHICSDSDLNLAGGNYVVNLSPKSKVGDTRFYTLSGLYASATQKKDVMLLNGQSDVSILKNHDMLESIKSHYPMYSSYDTNDTQIRGVISFDCVIGYRDVLRYKVLELRNDGTLESTLSTVGTYSYTNGW